MCEIDVSRLEWEIRMGVFLLEGCQDNLTNACMTQSNDQPNDRRVDRQLRTISRRVNRLEDTQVTWGELNVEFDRLYDEVDDLKKEMNQRFDSLETKFDLIMRHITREGNS
jgi:predicted nuclease with TOPRIM domain